MGTQKRLGESQFFLGYTNTGLTDGHGKSLHANTLNTVIEDAYDRHFWPRGSREQAYASADEAQKRIGEATEEERLFIRWLMDMRNGTCVQEFRERAQSQLDEFEYLLSPQYKASPKAKVLLREIEWANGEPPIDQMSVESAYSGPATRIHMETLDDARLLLCDETAPPTSQVFGRRAITRLSSRPDELSSVLQSAEPMQNGEYTVLVARAVPRLTPETMEHPVRRVLTLPQKEISDAAFSSFCLRTIERLVEAGPPKVKSSYLTKDVLMAHGKVPGVYADKTESLLLVADYALQSNHLDAAERFIKKAREVFERLKEDKNRHMDLSARLGETEVIINREIEMMKNFCKTDPEGDAPPPL